MPSRRLRSQSSFPILIWLFVTLVAAAVTSTPVRAEESPVVTRRVLFVGIDGCRFDALEAARTPHLDELRQDGIWSPTTHILGQRYRKNDTISGPGWSSILTGTWADKHGVQDNKFTKPNYDRYPHFFRRLKETRPETRSVSIVTWPPIHDFIVSHADRSLKFHDEKKEYARYDAEATAAAVSELREHDADALFLYFGQVDEMGHAHGFHPTVPAYREAIERVDAHLGEVLAALRARPKYKSEDWLVVVTADHGGSGKGHGGGHENPDIFHSFLIVSGASALRGRFEERTEIVDAPVTALAHLGVAANPDWQLDGRAAGLAPRYADHARPLGVLDDAGRERPVKTVADWEARRLHVRIGLQQAMGAFPDESRRVALDVQILEETRQEKYVRRKITYQVEPRRRAHAYLLIPHGLDADHRAAAVLALHPTHASGKGQVAGLTGNPTRFYAQELAERGFVVLAPDYPSFGDDVPFDLKNDPGNYASGSMRAIWDNVRGVDLLCAMPEVDARRIGAIGHSLGGHNALFTAVFEPRLKAIVTSCGFTAFARYYGGNLTGWTSDRYMPRLRDLYGLDPRRVPFDFHEVLAAIAPRAVRVVAPLGDANFDNPGVREVVDAARAVYALYGDATALEATYPDYRHDFPDVTRREVYEWLARKL